MTKHKRSKSKDENITPSKVSLFKVHPDKVDVYTNVDIRIDQPKQDSKNDESENCGCFKSIFKLLK